MTIADSRVVGWQYRLNNSAEGWSLWADCSQSNYEMLSLPRYEGLAETRALVDESLLAEAENRIVALQSKSAKENAFIRKLDGIIEEVGGVTASCINVYEDLKNALVGQKVRAEKAEASARVLQSRLDAVVGLVGKWVALAKSHEIRADKLFQDPGTVGWHGGYDEGVTECANELRAALGCATTGEGGT